MTRLAPAAEYESYPLAPGEEAAQPDLVGAVRRTLRGRYLWAIGIGAVLAAGGAMAGAMLPKPMYASVGLIDIAPRVPRVLYESEEKGMMPMYENYVSSQAMIAGGRRVIDMAMQSPEWKALGRPTTDAELASFQANLSVYYRDRTQFLAVSFTDPDPAVAVLATNEVMKAYMKIVDERENDSGVSTVKQLESQRALLNSRLNGLRADTFSISEDLGAESVEMRFKFALGEINKLDGVLHDLEVDIAASKAAAESAETDPGRVLSDVEIAFKDPVLDQLMQQRSEAEENVTDLQNDAKLGPNHPAVQGAKTAVALLDRRIAKRAKAYRAAMASTPDERAEKLKEKLAEKASVTALRDGVVADAKAIGKKLVMLASVQSDRSLATEQLDQVKRRLEQIDVESNGYAGRISVAQWGDRPVVPSTDRRLQFGVLGGFGGMALGFGIVLLWGFGTARLRHIDDVDGEAAKGRFLGILPDVDDNARVEDGPAAGELADFCVHHVRTMLQLRAAGRSRVVSLTSATPGDGKTTLAVALGMSFAATGSRTLLIDCDLVGHGLTSSMRSIVCGTATESMLAPDASGERSTEESTPNGRVAKLIAARRRRFGDAQIDEILTAAQALPQPLDPRLAKSVQALESLLRPRSVTGSRSRVRGGVLDALDGAPLEDCIVELETPNLSILPVAGAQAKDAESLSLEGLSRLLAKCRERYDTVLIDTGPMLGSIEAVMAAAAADYVVMVVARGGRQPVIRDALGRLERMGADVAGVVFNRASAADVAGSSYASRPSNTGIHAA